MYALLASLLIGFCNAVLVSHVPLTETPVLLAGRLLARATTSDGTKYATISNPTDHTVVLAGKFGWGGRRQELAWTALGPRQTVHLPHHSYQEVSKWEMGRAFPGEIRDPSRPSTAESLRLRLWADQNRLPIAQTQHVGPYAFIPYPS